MLEHMLENRLGPLLHTSLTTSIIHQSYINHFVRGFKALAKAEDTAQTAKAEATVAREDRRAVEAALRVLGRFVGPLRRLCLELREHKRFLARSYRLHAPLQVFGMRVESGFDFAAACFVFWGRRVDMVLLCFFFYVDWSVLGERFALLWFVHGLGYYVLIFLFFILFLVV